MTRSPRRRGRSSRRPGSRSSSSIAGVRSGGPRSRHSNSVELSLSSPATTRPTSSDPSWRRSTPSVRRSVSGTPTSRSGPLTTAVPTPPSTWSGQPPRSIRGPLPLLKPELRQGGRDAGRPRARLAGVAVADHGRRPPASAPPAPPGCSSCCEGGRGTRWSRGGAAPGTGWARTRLAAGFYSRDENAMDPGAPVVDGVGDFRLLGAGPAVRRRPANGQSAIASPRACSPGSVCGPPSLTTTTSSAPAAAAAGGCGPW